MRKKAAADSSPGSEMQIPFFCSFILMAFFAVVGFGQKANETVPVPKHANMPPYFSQFLPHDVLSQVFDNYDPNAGRVANILNSDHKPTLVQINEAQLWKPNRQEFLVVLVELAADDYQFDEGGLCGNCAAYVILAVLKKEEARLSLVAKQTPPRFSMPGNSVSLFDPFGPRMIGGHSSLSLDLTSYRLNGQESLIGIRDEHSVMGSESVSLNLFRIEGQRLREIFRDFLVDKRYSNSGQLRKTFSTLLPLRRKSGYYDYEMNKTIITCFDKDSDLDCDLTRDTIKRVRKQAEVWRFNGRKFQRILKH